MSDEYIKQLLRKLDDISIKIIDLRDTLFWTNFILLLLCVVIWIK